jgi:hypothetical protein
LKLVQFFDEVMVLENIHPEGILIGLILYPPLDKSKLEFAQNPSVGIAKPP